MTVKKTEGKNERLKNKKNKENLIGTIFYNKILKFDWLSTALISPLIGQSNRTMRLMPK